MNEFNLLVVFLAEHTHTLRRAHTTASYANISIRSQTQRKVKMIIIIIFLLRSAIHMQKSIRIHSFISCSREWARLPCSRVGTRNEKRRARLPKDKRNKRQSAYYWTKSIRIESHPIKINSQSDIFIVFLCAAVVAAAAARTKRNFPIEKRNNLLRFSFVCFVLF